MRLPMEEPPQTKTEAVYALQAIRLGESIVTDRTGKTIEKRQTVDFFYVGPLQGLIIDLREVPTVSGNQAIPPQIVIQVVLNKMPGPDGELDCYIVRESPIHGDPEKKILVQ